MVTLFARPYRKMEGILHSRPDSGQERRLWLRQISTQSNLVRASSQALIYTAISFSPDSKHLYYLAQKPDGSGELFRLPLIGGEARALIQDVDGAVALSPDGRQVAFVRHDPDSGQSKLMLADSDGTGERALATQTLNEGFLEGNLAWSPDGKVIASALWRVFLGNKASWYSRDAGVHRKTARVERPSVGVDRGITLGRHRTDSARNER